MIDNIFACPVRKYNIDATTEQGSYQVAWAYDEYEQNKFDYPTPFRKKSIQVPELLSKSRLDVQ